ncbi:MAG: 3-phosphoshikimate 1-carboxyvinyltransferase [Candidatus Bathyarchaeota archaeon]|nr:3-phosphoshikimate 1-carboxyvinyltransferase [Candidatus Bathyarchaeota archaeon]
MKKLGCYSQMTVVIIGKAERLAGEAYAPPSKAYTQRMLIAAALSDGTSKISNPLIADDTEAALRAVKALGAKVTAAEDCWKVEGAKPLKVAETLIDCGESGATLRFMIPVAALAPEPSIFLLGESLERRPIEPLLQCLKDLGVETFSRHIGGRASIYVRGGGIRGGKTSIRGDISSQFISGLMFACPLAQTDTEIAITTPLESKGYVQMTKAVIAEHGIRVLISEALDRIYIPARQNYEPCDHKVPGDFSSAAFLLAAAAITRSNVSVGNLDYASVQDDKAIVNILNRMGAKCHVQPDSVKVEGEHGKLEAVDVDARDIPDLVPVCAALACYAEGTSKIYGAQRLRYKESDRLLALHLELKKMGADITINEDGLTVKGPCAMQGATIDPHNDHRIAMACAIAALGAAGETRIQNAECVRKSYPQFFNDLRALGVDVIGGEFDR